MGIIQTRSFEASSRNCKKAFLTFVVSILPSVRLCQHGPHRTDFHEIWCCELLWKSVEKVEICLKLGKNIGQFTWRPEDVLLFTAIKIRHKIMYVQLTIFFILLTVTWSSTVHTKRIVAFPLQNGYSVTLYVHCLSRFRINYDLVNVRKPDSCKMGG